LLQTYLKYQHVDSTLNYGNDRSVTSGLPTTIDYREDNPTIADARKSHRISFYSSNGRSTTTPKHRAPLTTLQEVMGGEGGWLGQEADHNDQINLVD